MKRLKIISISLALLLLLSLSTSAYAANDLQTEFLVSIGFPLEVISQMDNEEVNYVLSLAQQYDIEYSSFTTAQLNSPTDDNISPFGLIPSSDMTLSVMALTIRGTTGTDGRTAIEGINVIISYEWADGLPRIKKEDAITLNWDNTVFTYKSFENTEYYCYSYGENGQPIWWSRPSVNDPFDNIQGAVCYYTNLVGTIPDYDYIKHKGIASVILVPASPIYVGTDHNTSLNVQYVHDKNPLLLFKPEFIFGPVSISVQDSALTDRVSASALYQYT